MLSFTKNETLLLDAYHKAPIFAASKILLVTLTVNYSDTRSFLKSKKTNNVFNANYKSVSTIKLETKTT